MLLPRLLHELHTRSAELLPRSDIEDLSDLSAANASNLVPSDPFEDKNRPLRAVVSVVCALSMIGAMLIILSYACIPSIRTKSREILVHLSVADFGVACSNFIGATVYFDQYIRNNSAHSVVSHSDLIHLCKAQAFFAGYSTIASILWTLCLSVYIYFLVVHSHRKLHSKVVYFCYVFCWGMPLLISLWLMFTGRLGYSPHGGSGWCSLEIDQGNRAETIFITVFGNDLWIYLTVVMVALLYFTTHCHIRWRLQGHLQSATHSSAVTSADVKFLLIPLVFLLLRLGSIIIVIVFVYAHSSVSKGVAYFLLYTAGIGDSGQGFVNAVLFCIFTAKVREKLWVGVKKMYIIVVYVTRCCCRKGYINLQQSSTSDFSASHSKKVPMSENA